MGRVDLRGRGRGLCGRGHDLSAADRAGRDSGIAGVADYEEMPWIGFGMAAGAPADIVAKLHDALVKALQSTEVRTRLAVLGDIETSTPAELQATIRRELVTNQQLITSGRVHMN